MLSLIKRACIAVVILYGALLLGALAAINSTRFERLANQYLACPESLKMYPYATASAIECSAVCNSEPDCQAVNFNRLNRTCELLAAQPFHASVSSIANSDWMVYSKPVVCAEKWTLYSNHCYLYNEASSTWAEARQGCLASGADLVDIQNDAENDFVFSFATNYSWSIFWIGLSDIEVEGVMRWSSGSTSTYRSFYPREPSNNAGENCVTSYILPHWNDDQCYASRPSICKI